MSNWIKAEPRAKCWKFICKFCRNSVLYINGQKVNDCDYPYCPYCQRDMEIRRIRMSKYKIGELITSFDSFSEQEFIYDSYAKKIYHHGWIQSWQFRMVKMGITQGRFYKVEKGE